MTIAEGIRRHGFATWYERQMLRSHAHLALTVFCTLGILGALEASSSSHTLADKALDLLGLLLCSAVGLWALRRYLFLLSHAEAAAHQAECPACGTYARFRLVQADASGDTVQVCCRHCDRLWQITT